MGRFGNTVSAETKAKSNTIVVNKYEIAENALEIMSKICSPKNEDDFEQYFYDLAPILWPAEGDSFRDFVEGDGNDFKFWHYFWDFYQDVKTALASHDNTNATQVVVAGAYSSGKSTFLNTILGHKGLLPTGVEPISIVNTFIYCSQGINEVNVKGVNLKNVLVQLDTDVLQCIQHASNSNVYLASVLEKLIIEYPANDLTKGLSFIDTPGYNKSDEKNEVNDKTDKETAMQALEQGDVLFWLVDIQDGTIVTTGEEMINHFLDNNEDGKVVIIFNKADKDKASMRSDVEATARKFKVSQDSRFIDVIAYSSDDPQIYFSYKGLSLERLFKKVRCCSSGYSEVQKIMDRLKSMFDNRIEWHENEKKEWTEALEENKKQKNEWYKELHDLKEQHKSEIEWYKKIIIDTYSQIYNVADGEGDFTYYDEDSRNAALEQIKFVYGCRYDMLKGVYEELCEKINNKQNAIDRENSYIALWRDYKNRIVRVLENGIAKANASKKRRGTISATVKTDRPLDIFQAILNCDYSHFENCFTKGVSLNNFNPEGYSPLTYAVKTGQNDMVQFFIEHNADLSAYDGRGYNAIQTAVENNYKDICQMLLDYDKSLAKTRSRSGEDLMTIAKKNTFENWLSKNI